MISGNNHLSMNHQTGVMSGVNANGILAMAVMKSGHGVNGIAIGIISMTIVSIRRKR